MRNSSDSSKSLQNNIIHLKRHVKKIEKDNIDVNKLRKDLENLLFRAEEQDLNFTSYFLEKALECLLELDK